MRDAHLAENIFQTRSSNNFKRRQEIRLISYIKGTVAYKGKDSVVIENHGIGYQIKVPSRVLEGVNSGEEAMLHTYLYVREDQLALFGFSSIQELETFQILLGISGIGPKAALSVLSTMSVEDLYYAVFSEDAKSIAKTPGIGPKGAKRMIIELKDKLNLEDLESVSGTEEAAPQSSSTEGDSIADTVQALVALGYSNGEAYRAVHSVPEAEKLDAEQSLKEALKTVLTFLSGDNMDRMISTELMEEDIAVEGSLRPQNLSEYIGQEKVKKNLRVFIEAAKMRGESLDHVLLYGPPGLGKTTLAGIIANEMDSNLKITSGPAIEKPGEIAAVLNGLSDGDVLFIDEIHRLNRQVEEVLYPAMEDFSIDIMIGKGASAKSIRLELPHFTLVGATTRAGMLTAPLRDRFGVVNRLEFYTDEELKVIVERSAELLGVKIDEAGAMEVGKRSRGTPRLANRLLKRVRDFAQVRYDGMITYEVAQTALNLLEVDSMGLDATDRNLLEAMITKFMGKPVGLDTLAAAIGEDSGTIEDVYEPFLIQRGLIKRTPRGRALTAFAYEHMGYPVPEEIY